MDRSGFAQHGNAESSESLNKTGATAWPGLELPARVFVYEHICSGGLGNQPPASLREEGEAMWRSLLNDLHRAGCEVLTMAGSELGLSSPRGCRMIASDARSHKSLFARCVDDAAGTIIIAPETDGVLEDLSRSVLSRGADLLGSSPDAVALCADKLRTTQTLAASGLPTLESRACHEPDLCPHDDRVIKMRRGAGSEGARLVRRGDRVELSPEIEWIDTRHVAGMACSVLCIVARETTIICPPCSQRLSTDGTFRYLGGTAPLPAPHSKRAEDLARAAVKALPGLRGFVGIDMILSAEIDAENCTEENGIEKDYIVEVNPRLTTSFTGLRQLAHTNLAATWLSCWTGERVRTSWRPGPITFDARGVRLRCTP